MAYKKGESGNPNGRPAGAKNKVNDLIREQIGEFINGKFELITKDFETMKPAYRWKLIVELMPYVTPRLQSTKNDISFGDMTEEQLDEIIDRLKIASGIKQDNNE